MNSDATTMVPDPRPPEPDRAAPRGLVDPLGLAAGALAAAAAFHLRTVCLLAGSDAANLAGEEGNVVWAIGRMRLRGVLYTDPSASPFAVVQYTPVYYRFCAGLAALTGVRPDDAAGVTSLARSVSLACLIGQVVVLGVLLRRHLAVSWDLVLAGCVCLFVAQGVWGVAARPDAMEVMVAALAVLAALEAVRAGRGPNGGVGWLAAAIVAAALAGLVKQNGLDAGLYALPGAMFALGRRRAALAVLAALVPVALLVAGAFHGMGTLAAVRGNLVDGLNNGVAPLAALHLAYIPYLRTFSALASGGLLAAVWPWSRLARARRAGQGGLAFAATPAELIVGWATLAAFAFAVLSALKYGSAPNYFLMFNLFAVAAAARFLETRRLSTTDGTASAWSWFAALFLVLFLGVRAFEERIALGNLTDHYADCAEVAQRLRAALDNAPEGALFFSTDPRLDALIPDRAALPQKLIAALQDRRGVIDFSGFAHDVRAGTVRYCVTFSPDDPSRNLADAFRAFTLAQPGAASEPGRATFVGASFDRFRVLFRVGPHTVYVEPWAADPAPRTSVIRAPAERAGDRRSSG